MTDELEFEPDFEDDGTPIVFNKDGKALICPCCRHHVRAYDFDRVYDLCDAHHYQYPEPIRRALCHQHGDDETIKWARIAGDAEALTFHRAHADADGWIELIGRSEFRGDNKREVSRFVALNQIVACGYGR